MQVDMSGCGGLHVPTAAATDSSTNAAITAMVQTTVVDGGGGRGALSLVASGTDLQSAAVITSGSANVDVTGANGSNGVRLTDVTGALVYVLNNNGINALNVYPPNASANLGSGLPLGQPFVIPAQGASMFMRFNPVQWIATDV
jgi:hypothetical protein